jgi:alpha-D-xyloside xylohydrolase
MRVHGQAPKREMWEFGGDGSPAYKAQLKFDRLRYVLLPYIYSLAAGVTRDGGTIMRPLAMDFPSFTPVIDDQYMFGPALMVSPVTAYKIRERDVVLPPTPGGWYDFWTGAALASGNHRVPAPFDQIPLHVPAGAVIPFGPELQFTAEKPANPITMFVYAGRDGSFTLYEDDGTTTAYENGAYATIPIRWDDRTRTLTIGDRRGSYPHMPDPRIFHVVLVTKSRPVPFSLETKVADSVGYAGSAVTVKL